MDSGENMAGIIINIIPVDMIYDYDFTGASDTTDAKGQFEFAEITPGSYQLQCIRNSFAVLDENLVVEHADKQTQIALPKPIIARTSYGPPHYPSLQGIVWKNSDTFAGVGVYRDYTHLHPHFEYTKASHHWIEFELLVCHLNIM